MNNKTKITNFSERGVSLIMTFFIMVIILSIILSLSLLLYSEIKVLRNMGNSVTSFYAADSGVEKVLYYDRKVVTDENVSRGLCSMNNNCSNLESSVGCINANAYNTDSVTGTGCNDCTDCRITFSTLLDNGIKYDVEAIVDTDTETYLNIKSRGNFGNTSRQIETSITGRGVEQALLITNACANPRSVSVGTQISVSADISVTDQINYKVGSAKIYVHDANGRFYKEDGTVSGTPSTPYPINFPLAEGTDKDGTYSKAWQTNVPGSYFVNLEVSDLNNTTNESENTKVLSNLKPCNY